MLSVVLRFTEIIHVQQLKVVVMNVHLLHRVLVVMMLTILVKI